MNNQIQELLEKVKLLTFDNDSDIIEFDLDDNPMASFEDSQSEKLKIACQEVSIEHANLLFDILWNEGT
jgi:hypothetical protein